MSRRRPSTRSLPLLLIVLIACAPRLAAWGRTGHFWITERALDSVSSDLKALLERHRSELVRLSIAADERRRSDPAEGFRHYLDLDNYGPFPHSGFSTDRAALESVWGAEWVREQGTVVWAIQDSYGELVEAFRTRRIGAIRRSAADLGHYVSDLHQPFHASGNHDGQRSGQDGIHARFESHLVEDMQAGLRFEAQPVRRIGPLPAAMERVARESLQWVDNILTADRRIAAEMGIDRRKFRDLPYEERRFPDEYYRRMQSETGFIVQLRTGEAATVVASLWQQAWEEAGRPDF